MRGGRQRTSGAGGGTTAGGIAGVTGGDQGLQALSPSPTKVKNTLTINAAAALELQASHGRIALGRKSPLILTKEVPSLAYLAYAYTEKHIQRIFN